MMKMYLAGPMSGIPQFNYPRFDYVAGELRTLGYDVQSPAEMDSPETRAAALASEDGSLGSGVINGESWGDFLARDVKLVADEIDGVCLLEGWDKSRGARLEAFVALTVRKPVYFWNDQIGPMEADPDEIMEFIDEGTCIRNEEEEKRYG